MTHLKTLAAALFLIMAMPAQANDTIDSVRSTAADVTEKTRDVASDAYEKSKDVGGQIWDKMKEVGNSAADATRDGVDRLRSYTEDASCDEGVEDCSAQTNN